MKTLPVRLPGFAALVFGAPLFFIGLHAAAPSAPTPVTTTASRDEAIELSPFVVRDATDTGYAATNTLDGSRLNTALRDTPGAISVFTKDFIDDIGATSLEDILRYDVNAVSAYSDDDSSGVGNQSRMFGEGFAFRVRELGGSFSVDGFRSANQPNTYNIERVGSGRGPNAILFGTGSPGGNLNFHTRGASFTRNLASIDLKVADESTRRATLDVSRVLLKNKLAFRVMGVRERKGSPLPHQYTDFQGITVTGTWRIARHTDLTASYQRDHTEGVSGRSWNHVDALSRFATQLNSGQLRWNQALERYENANGTALVAASAGTGTLVPRTVLIYGPDLSVAPALWEGASTTTNRTTNSSAASIFNTATAPIIDERFEPFGAVTATGPGEFAGVSTDNFTATFNHRWFSHVFMELAYNHATRASDTMVGGNPDIRADLNYRLPDGTLNPFFYGNSYYFSQDQWLRLNRHNNNNTLRASLSYELNLGPGWGTHRFAGMVERNVNHESRLRMREVWAGRPYGGNPEDTANRINRRRYFKVGGPFASYTAGFDPVNPFRRESFRSAFATLGPLNASWAPANEKDFNDETTTDSKMIVMQNYLFDRRLVTTIGVRDDAIETVGPSTLRDATTGFYRFATAADQTALTPLKREWRTSARDSGLRKSFGAVLHVTKNFSLTANYANGVQLAERNASVLPTETTPPPVQGETRDYGVAFSFLDNRVSGSVKRFESKSIQERTQSSIGAVYITPNNDVMSSFDFYLRQAGVTTFGASDPIKNISELTSVYFSQVDAYLADRIAKGSEVELTANPTRNWTLRASYSHTDRTKTNVLYEGAGWWSDRIALWKSLDSLYMARTGRPSIFNQTYLTSAGATGTYSVAQRIADSDVQLAQLRLEEAQSYGNRADKANLWTRYSFPTGKLKGAAIGGGWRYQSANVAGVDLATKRNLMGNPRSLFDLLLQYRTKGFMGMWTNATSVTYQLNVTNLLDDRTVNATKLDLDSVTGTQFYRRAFREDPRVVAFTLRTDF